MSAADAQGASRHHRPRHHGRRDREKPRRRRLAGDRLRHRRKSAATRRRPRASRSRTDAAAVAAKATNILVSLPKPEALIATVEAIADAKLPRRVIAELSTFSLEDKTQAEAALRAAGHVMLDCPLSGTGAQARTKDLVVYASGDAQAIKA